MEKDHDLKRDPRYQTANLREKVNQSIKRNCDDSDEVKQYPTKQLAQSGSKYDKERNKNDW